MENIDNIPQPSQIIEKIEKLDPRPQKKFPLTQKQLYLIILAATILIFSLISLVIFQAKNKAQQVQESKTSTAIDQTYNQTPPVSPPTVDTSDWKTYQDEKVGFSFKYPSSIDLDRQSQQANQLGLNIVAEKLADIPEELPMMMGRDYAIQEKDRLAKGEGQNIVKIGLTYGQTSFTYSLFEECSVMFVRKLTFYHNDYRISVSLIGPEKQIMADMPDFFKIDPTHCGENKMWNRDYSLDFETTLRNQQGTGMGQLWFNSFDAMTKTFALTQPKITIIPSPTPTPSPTPSPVNTNQSVYTNDTYGFEITYDNSFKLQASKDDLYGYPHGVALLYSGGQAYDIVIEVWDNKADYEKEYEFRLNDIKVFQNKGKYLTFLNNDPSSTENQKIIDSIKIIP